MTTLHDLARFYRALGDETRLQLVALLARQQPGHALCVGRLAHDLGVTPSAISQHLRVLKDLGLVHAYRQRYRIHYYLDWEHLSAYQMLAHDSLGAEFVLVGMNPNARQEDNDLRCCEQNGCHRPEQSPAEATCSSEQIHARHGEAAEYPREKQGQEERTEEV